MGQERCATCTIVLFFSHYRCLCMLQLTMHSPVTGAAVNPEAFTQIRAMQPHRIIAPEELTAATELTVQSCCTANPNGGKHSALGTSRRRFEPSHSNSIHRGMRSTPSLFARGSATPPLPPPLVSCLLMADAYLSLEAASSALDRRAVARSWLRSRAHRRGLEGLRCGLARPAGPADRRKEVVQPGRQIGPGHFELTRSIIDDLMF
jgi:hypothetical protein